MSFGTKIKQQGFTIVELLIVIVVIGILAAITIVAYNGIQNRGKLAAGQALGVSLVKKLEAFNSINSVYPSYCQLVTNSITPTGAAPTAGTTGAGTCVAGGVNAGAESKIDNVATLTPVSAAAGTGYTSTVSNSNAVAGYWLCGASTGANVYYWDFSATTPAIVKDSAGTAC